MRGRIAFVCFCLLAAAVPLLDAGKSAENSTAESDAVFSEGIEAGGMTQLELSSKEKLFFSIFPGKAAKFGNGRETVILRTVSAPTRLLHPAMECFKGMGYAISRSEIHRDDRERMWGSFLASHPDMGAYRIREIIFDSDGESWSDVSAWYWNAEFGLSKGPWTSVVAAEKMN